MYTLSPVGTASTGFQKCKKKTVTWKYSSASDIDSVYALRVSDNGGMLICRFAWWGRPYGRVKNAKKIKILERVRYLEGMLSQPERSSHSKD